MTRENMLFDGVILCSSDYFSDIESFSFYHYLIHTIGYLNYAISRLLFHQI